jgi:penicillin-binding protein 1A
MNGAPSIDALKPIDSGANSKVYAADGSLLGIIDADIVREPVKLKKVPNILKNATIAIEDETFYEHNGVDFTAIARAAVKNAEAGGIEQGASTITQQLVRNLYIKKPEDTLERKLIEAKLAMDYEDRFSKNKILEQYLNTATYGTNSGDTAVGVEAASQVYFDKSVSDLNVREAAMIAGLPQAPSQYNPFTNAEAAQNRRNLVLKAMQEAGMLSQERFAKLRSTDLGLSRGLRYDQFRYRFFFDYVQQELVDRYGTNVARVGGLNVYTTLEPRLQDTAEQAIAANPTTGAAAALVSTDTATGEIKAMASSQSYDDNEFNLAAQGERQPGSAFKPFALTAAVDMGVDPDSTFYAAPSSITLSPCSGCDPWSVSGGAGGSISLRQATASSINTVYAQLVLDIGPEAMDEMAAKMGITAELNNYPAEVLGALTYGVSVLEMSNAYATLANGGVHHKPTAIERVEFPDGEVEQLSKPKGNRVIADGVAYEVADVMKGALESGGTAPSANYGCPASGKTGTTEVQSDAWFVGYTPHVSTAVWVGNPNARVPLPGYGADLAAPIWRDYMEVAASKPCDDFPAPKDPVSLSAGKGSRAVSSKSDSGRTTPTSPDSTTSPPPSGDADGDGYPDDIFAPGADQQPAPGPKD